jgi:adenosine deaminase
MLSPELLVRMPKAELHVHLDGSLRPTTLIELAKAAKVKLPSQNPVEVARFMKAEGVRDLAEYLERFSLTVAVLQTQESLERVAYEMVVDAAADGVRHLEVRYCPILSCTDGLTMPEVLAAIGRGLRRGETDTGITTGFIACTLRHLDPSVSEEIARAAVGAREHGVVGFDIAGGEASHPALPHRSAFEIAARGGLGITVHAGEAVGAESIAEAVYACRAERIGHGTRLGEDPALLAYVRDREIPLEVSLTSNVQTHAVASIAQHPLRRFFRAGVSVTLSTDNWLISGVTLSGEYWRAHTELGFRRADIDRLILNGAAAAFLPLAKRQALVTEFRHQLEELR